MIALFCEVLVGAWLVYHVTGLIIERADAWLERRDQRSQR